MPRPTRAVIPVLLAVVALAVHGAAARSGAGGEAAAAEKSGSEIVAVEKEEKAEPHDPPAPSRRAECRFLGVKMVRVLLRDDLIAGEGFHQFYERFDCPIDHVGHALGCAAPAARVDDATVLQRHVETCWDDPSVELRVRVPLKPTPREGETDGPSRNPRSGTSPF